MRLHQRLADYATVWIPDSAGAPATLSTTAHRRVRRWYKDTASVNYESRQNGLQARTLRAASGNQSASLYVPGAPYHRMRIIAGNAQSTSGTVAIYGARRLGDYAQIASYNLPSSDYAVHDFDAKTIGSGDYYPTAYRIQIESTTSAAAEIGDLWLYAYADIAPLLQDLIPIRTTYETSVYAPLADNALLARSLQSRAYQIALLVPRSEVSLPWLLSLREGDNIEIEQGDIYLPCTIQSAESRPAGGALWEVTYQAVATAPYAYSPERSVIAHTHASQSDLHGYYIDGTAPSPTELRLQITNTHDSDIRIHIQPTGEVITIHPDDEGIWSIHDTGRIYHIPAAPTAQWIDRTDVLRAGALPIILPQGDGLVALEHNTNWGIPYITIAYYPRYMPEDVL